MKGDVAQRGLWCTQCSYNIHHFQ